MKKKKINSILIIGNLIIFLLLNTSIVRAKILYSTKHEQEEITLYSSNNLLNVYLPIILNSPDTPPPPPPPPPPLLKDGYYKADLPYGGSIWFTVTDNGTKARNGGFIFYIPYVCPYSVHTFPRETKIDNGSFGWSDFDFIEREFIASLGCSANSTDQALCHAWKPSPYTGCGGSDGIATFRY